MGQGAIRKLLTRKINVGWRRFGKPEAEVVEMAVPPIIDAAELEAVQALLEIRARRSRPRASSRNHSQRHLLFLRPLRHRHDAGRRQGWDRYYIHTRPRPGSAILAARGARSGWKRSTASSPTISKSD
jgi:hypothetical protein